MIDLVYGGQFDERALVAFIKASGRDYVIQGQQKCSREKHTKPHSLDYWFRQFAANPNTKQAENRIVDALVSTGLFRVAYDLICPDSNRRCKGLQLL